MSYKSLVQIIKEHNTPVELDEIKQQEVDALKKLSKEMQAVLKGYQKIARMGDKELTNTKYNKDYEAVLKSRDVILQLIDNNHHTVIPIDPQIDRMYPLL